MYGMQEEHLTTQLWWATSRLVVTCLSTINPVNVIVRSSWCVAREMPWQQEMFLLRKSEPEISASKRTRKRSKDTYTSVGLRTD